MATRRQRRVSDLIQQELSDLIAREMQDPRLGLVTLTHVELTPDLHIARVYFTTLAEESQEQALEALQKAASFLRRELGSRVRLKFTPQLEFRVDRSLAQSMRIESLLDRLASEQSTEALASEQPSEAGDGPADETEG